eukprot:815510-Prymnesium_polylepis.1
MIASCSQGSRNGGLGRHLHLHLARRDCARARPSPTDALLKPSATSVAARRPASAAQRNSASSPPQHFQRAAQQASPTPRFQRPAPQLASPPSLFERAAPQPSRSCPPLSQPRSSHPPASPPPSPLSRRARCCCVRLSGAASRPPAAQLQEEFESHTHHSTVGPGHKRTGAGGEALTVGPILKYACWSIGVLSMGALGLVV